MLTIYNLLYYFLYHSYFPWQFFSNWVILACGKWGNLEQPHSDTTVIWHGHISLQQSRKL